MMKRHLRTMAGALAAVGLCLAAAACSTSPSPAKPTPKPAASSAVPTLQPFPVLPENQVLIEKPRIAGRQSLTTRALTSRNITVQLACVGSADGRVGAIVYQAGKPIYTISKQPCNGLVQKITLTPDTTTPLTLKAQADPGNQYALLVTEQ